MTHSETAPLLVVLTGPVGGGKSTTALSLAAVLRRGGHRVAVVDLDLLADMVRPHPHYGEPDLWQQARRICGGLADVMYREGYDVVVVEGEFFSAAELAALTDALTTPADVRMVTLEVSYAGCRARVDADPSPMRHLSRDPAFLGRLNEQFYVALAWLSAAGIVLPADDATLDALAAQIVAALGPRREPVPEE